jgi:ABC-type glycerol-3-phosphate transport system substrate-binding protein
VIKIRCQPYTFRVYVMSILSALTLLLAACQGPISTGAARPTPTKTAAAPGPTATTARTRRALPSDTPKPTPTSTRLPHLSIGAEKLRGLQIRFWHPWSGLPGREMASLVDEFNQTNPWGIHVLAAEPGSSAALYAQVSASLADGSSPQVVAAPSEAIFTWAERSGVVIDLQDYLLDEQWGLSEAQAGAFFPLFWQQELLQGRRLAIPALRTAGVLLYNASWAEELGFGQPPAAPEDFQAQACAAARSMLQDNSPLNDGTGGWIVDTQALSLLGWLGGFGVQRFTGPSGRFEFNTAAGREGFSYLRSLFDQSCAWNSRLPQPYEYFANRQALFYSATLADILLQQRAMQHLNNTDRWSVLGYPAQQGQPVVFTSGQSYALLAASAEQQLAGWLFIRWLAQPEPQARLVRASGSWPVSQSALDLLADYQAAHTQWSETLPFIQTARPAPQSAGWRVAQNVLEDAAWQLFQANVKLEQVPAILQQLDATIPEILLHTP